MVYLSALERSRDFAVFKATGATNRALLVGLLTALEGRALVEYRRYQVGVVFKSFNLVASLTASENVQAPLRLAGTTGRSARARAEELLARVDLADRRQHRPADLSGGKSQRVAIARALAHDPPLVLADEPTRTLTTFRSTASCDSCADSPRPGASSSSPLTTSGCCLWPTASSSSPSDRVPTSASSLPCSVCGARRPPARPGRTLTCYTVTDLRATQRAAAVEQ